MASIDEYISDYLTNIETYEDVRGGFQNVSSTQIPAAQIVTDPNAVVIIQQSTARGAQEIIPIIDTTRGQILEDTNLRDDVTALTQVLTAKIDTTEGVTSTSVSQTEIDSREEAFVPVSPETPQTPSIIQSSAPPETLPITEIIPDLSVETTTEQQVFQQEAQEQSTVVDLKVSIEEDVSQSIPPEAQVIIQEFAATFIDAEEQSQQNRELIASSTEVTVERFVFDPTVSLFAAADAAYSSIGQAVQAQATIQDVVADTSGVSFESFTSTESLASTGG